MPNGMFMNSANLLPHITGGQLPLIPLSNIDDKVRRLLRKIVSFGFLDRPQLDSSIPLDDPASIYKPVRPMMCGWSIDGPAGSLAIVEHCKVFSLVGRHWWSRRASQPMMP
jgi:hypothetical protein